MKRIELEYECGVQRISNIANKFHKDTRICLEYLLQQKGNLIMPNITTEVKSGLLGLEVAIEKLEAIKMGMKEIISHCLTSELDECLLDFSSMTHRTLNLQEKRISMLQVKIGRLKELLSKRRGRKERVPIPHPPSPPAKKHLPNLPPLLTQLSELLSSPSSHPFPLQTLSHISQLLSHLLPSGSLHAPL